MATKNLRVSTQRRKEKPPPANVELTHVIPRELYNDLADLAKRNDIDIHTIIRLSLKALLRKQMFFKPVTPISFGKYQGEKMADVIRVDPRYVVWCCEKVDGFTLSPEAEDILNLTLGS